jgi:hypothetical protein
MQLTDQMPLGLSTHWCNLLFLLVRSLHLFFLVQRLFLLSFLLLSLFLPNFYLFFFFLFSLATYVGFKIVNIELSASGSLYMLRYCSNVILSRDSSSRMTPHFFAIRSWASLTIHFPVEFLAMILGFFLWGVTLLLNLCRVVCLFQYHLLGGMHHTFR